MNGWGVLIVRESCGETGYEVLTGGGDGANGRCMAWKRFDTVEDAEAWIMIEGARAAALEEQIERFDIFQMWRSYGVRKDYSADPDVGDDPPAAFVNRLRGAHS